MSRRVILLRYGLLFVAIGFVIAGVARQEYVTVFQKAAKVCLECIGIG